jgi:hypothetical protein
VGEGAGRRADLRVAAVSVIRDARALIAVVLESDERTGVRAVRARHPAFAHGGIIPK